MKRLLPVVLFAALAAVILYPSWGKMTLTTDGVNYISTAENLARGRGPVNYTGQMELVHPFGYSAALVPFIWLGLTSQQAAFAVNWFSLVLVGLMALLLLRDLTGLRDWRTVAGASLVMFNPPLANFANQILSETMCAALVLLFLWLCVKGRWPVLIAFVGLALCLTRYPGLAIVLGGGLFLKSWRDRAIVIAPVLVILAVALLLPGSTSAYFAFSNMRPGLAWNVVDGTVAAVAGIGFMALLVYLVVKFWHLLVVRISSAAVILFTLGLAASALVWKVNPTLDLRLFVPISGVLVLLLIGLSLRYLPDFGPYLLVGMAYYTVATFAPAMSWLMSSKSKVLNDPATTNSTAMQHLKEVPDSIDIYSTCPAAIYIATGADNGGRVTKALPNRLYTDKQEKRSTADKIRETGGILVWFKQFNSGYAGPKAFLDQMDRIDSTRVLGYEDAIALIVPVVAVVPKDTIWHHVHEAVTP